MDKRVLKAIQRHAISEYEKTGKEACGVVILEGGKEKYVRIKNLSKSAGNFVMCTDAYLDAEDRGEILMVVHSHPDASCQPSEADKVMCEETALPWMIVSVYRDLITGEMNADDYVIIEPSGYEAPLVGRRWCPPRLDCYSLIRDYFKRELDIEIPDFALELRAGDWWDDPEQESLYLKHFEEAGFFEVTGSPLQHDVLIMEVASRAGPNHAGIYLGDDTGYFLHHLHSRLSREEIFGGYWLRNTRKIVRHKEVTCKQRK